MTMASLFDNRSIRKFLTLNAYKDLILSRAFSYEKFIDSFDRELVKEGFTPTGGR